jgi:hypothetical protein
MKRKISFVIAFFVSLFLMFSLAMAQETKLTTASTSEPIELKALESPQDTNKAYSPPHKANSPSQLKVKVPAIKKPAIDKPGI